MGYNPLLPDKKDRVVVDELRKFAGISMKRTQIKGTFYNSQVDVNVKRGKTSNRWRNIESLTDMQNSSQILEAKEDWIKSGGKLSDLIMSESFKTTVQNANRNMKSRLKYREKATPDEYQELISDPVYRLGGLGVNEYKELKNTFYSKHIDDNNWLRLLNEARKEVENYPSKAQENEKMAEALIDYMATREAINYKRGVDKGKTKAKEKNIELGMVFKDYARVVEDTGNQMFNFNRRDITELLQNPQLTDKDLDKALITADGRLSPKLEFLFRDFFGESLAHLSEGGLQKLVDDQQRQLKDIKNIEDFNRWFKEISKQIGRVQITKGNLLEVKGKIPENIYNMIKETIETEGSDSLSEDMYNYILKLSQGWVGAPIVNEEESLYDKLKKLYRKMTPKYKIRQEAWFKAAKIEFTGSKYYPVLIDLANRIAEEDYKKLFEVDTEIKQWYQNWGNDDERVKELIELLEANTGLKADWKLSEDLDNEQELDNEAVQTWIGERREYYEAMGFGSTEINNRILKELRDAGHSDSFINEVEFYLTGVNIDTRDLGIQKGTGKYTINHKKRIK